MTLFGEFACFNYYYKGGLAKPSLRSSGSNRAASCCTVFGHTPATTQADGLLTFPLRCRARQQWVGAEEEKPIGEKQKGLAAMEQQLRNRLRDCAARVNENYDVDALCRAFPARLQEVVVAGGERLGH